VAGSITGTLLELDVTGIAHGGVAVARHEGRVVFVADAIPGERVVARVRPDSKERYWRAETVRVLEPSPDRVAHVWPEAAVDRDPAERAGGAEFGHIALARQRALKAEVLADALRRMAGLDLPIEVEPAPGDDERGGLGWRTRVRLHVDDAGVPGPFAARSHRVVPVASLPLATDAIARSGVLGERFPGEEHVDVIDSGGEARLVVGRQRATTLVERVGGRVFRVDDTGFWQVHRQAPGVLTEAVRAAIDPARFDAHAANLDLYGGVGLFAAAIADVGGIGTRVETVESDAAASAHAAENLASLPNAVATRARVDRWVRDAVRSGARTGATIVLDPPRSGAGREVVEGIARLGAAQLVYVACDPVALARDARTLSDAGYRLERVRAFDLFPHTHHVEAVATFLPV